MKASPSNVDKYLDASKFIRTLEEAERGHQLDTEAVLEELSKAAEYCAQFAAYHGKQRDDYMLAQAAYFAEIRRRTSPGRAGRGKISAFPLWCKDHMVSVAYASELATIGDASDPLSKLNRIRYHKRQRSVRYRAAQAAASATTNDDPLHRIRIEWFRLSTRQREAFADWIWDQINGKKAAAD